MIPPKAPAMVSEVLSGKRALSKEHIRRRRERRGLPVDVFFDQ